MTRGPLTLLDSWQVFDNGGLRQYERKHNLRNGEATEMLCDALDALHRHYFLTGVCAT